MASSRLACASDKRLHEFRKKTGMGMQIVTAHTHRCQEAACVRGQFASLSIMSALVKFREGSGKKGFKG